MEILGIGPSELVFILIIAIIVLGPKDMQKAGRMMAKWMRSILTSDAWLATQQISREARKQWTHLLREANEDLNRIDKDIKITSQYQNPPRSISTETTPASASVSANASSPKDSESSIQPPATEPSETDTEEHD